MMILCLYIIGLLLVQYIICMDWYRNNHSGDKFLQIEDTWFVDNTWFIIFLLFTLDLLFVINYYSFNMLDLSNEIIMAIPLVSLLSIFKCGICDILMRKLFNRSEIACQKMMKNNTEFTDKEFKELYWFEKLACFSILGKHKVLEKIKL